MFGGLFDFNRDGKTDALEFALGMSILEDMDEADQRDELDAEGLDYDELEGMDECERREALEDAGLDPDDFDF